MNLKLNYEGFEDNLYSVYIGKSKSEYEFVFQKNECVVNVIIYNDQYTRRRGDDLWGVKIGWGNAMNTADSRFAASLDRIQPFMHNVLTEGHTWKLGTVTKEQVYRRMAPVKTGTPALWPWLESQVAAAIEKGWIKER